VSSIHLYVEQLWFSSSITTQQSEDLARKGTCISSYLLAMKIPGFLALVFGQSAMSEMQSIANSYHDRQPSTRYIPL